MMKDAQEPHEKEGKKWKWKRKWDGGVDEAMRVKASLGLEDLSMTCLDYQRFLGL